MIHSIAIHVGTNNQVSDDIDGAVNEMEYLILDLKLQANNVVVLSSSVIHKHDNKLPHSLARMKQFDHSVHELCGRHNTSFIRTIVTSTSRS